MKRVNLNSVLEDIERLLGRTLGEDIELEMQLDPQLAEVQADEDRLKYVILHIVINARGAMMDTAAHIKISPISGQDGHWEVKPRAGRNRLIIATSNVDIGKSDCEKRPNMRPGRHVMVSITDTGVGMPEEVRAHIFEPFFTTREVGQGAGLGLSSIYGTWKQMGGEIVVESELGKGTTFKLCLPCADPAIVPVPDGRKSQAGRETLLVVEDDDSVREFTVRMLKSLGYSVLSAPNGQKGLELFTSQAAQIDMVITDMIMPNMTGRQFVDAARRIDKDMKILFVSGYSPDDTADGAILGKSVAFFQKPYTRDQLSKKIREVLDGKTA